MFLITIAYHGKQQVSRVTSDLKCLKSYKQMSELPTLVSAVSNESERKSANLWYTIIDDVEISDDWIEMVLEELKF